MRKEGGSSLIYVSDRRGYSCTECGSGIIFKETRMVVIDNGLFEVGGTVALPKVEIPYCSTCENEPALAHQG